MIVTNNYNKQRVLRYQNIFFIIDVSFLFNCTIIVTLNVI